MRVDTSLAKKDAKLKWWEPDMGAQLSTQRSVMSVTRKGRSFHNVPSTVGEILMPYNPGAGLVGGPIPWMRRISGTRRWW